MREEDRKTLINEIKGEQQISPFFDDKVIENYVKEAEFDINKSVGTKVDYNKDLKARSLLKNYVMYANHKRLAEFKQLYIGEYIELQIEYYNKTTNIS